MKDTIENFEKQHFITYQNAVIDLIKNNTNALVDSDLISLIKRPPLDSMDTIKSKLLFLAKKEKIILDSDKMSKILDQFRNLIIEDLLQVREIRSKKLIEKVQQFSINQSGTVIKIKKKDLDSVNKEIKKFIKNSLNKNIKEYLLIEIKKIYQDHVDIEKSDFIYQSFCKYMKTVYSKQLNENISIKILVKDRTLLSGITEQGERYLFTKANSHIFDIDKE